MANAKKCDICGKFYDHYGSKNPVNFKVMEPNMIDLGYEDKDGADTWTNQIDCCPTCMKSIQDHIDNLKKGNTNADN